MKRDQAAAKLDKFGIDAYVEAITGGATMTDIAKKLRVSRGSLVNWLADDPDRARRAHGARQVSAAAWDDRAEQAILDAKDVLGLAKARELAQHYRWRASKLDPAYSDKLGIGQAAGLPPIVEELSVIDIARRMAFIFAEAQQQMRNERPPLRVVSPLPLTFNPTAEHWE